MKPWVLALLLILAKSATLKQDTNSNSLQPLQSLIQLFGDTWDSALRVTNRIILRQMYPRQEADSTRAQIQACDNTLWDEILPQILSDDLERLAETCQDSNRTALLNRMMEDIVQGVANSTDPCIPFFARVQADFRSYLDGAVPQGWQLDLGWTSSGQQYSVPVDTVVDNLQRLPGFLDNDPTDPATVELTADINTLSTDVADTELLDTDDFASIVDSWASELVNINNQQLYQALIQFLNDAASILCSIVGPTDSATGS